MKLVDQLRSLARRPAMILAATLLACSAAHADSLTGFAMVYFTESPNGSGNSDALYLAISPDGLNWEPMNQNSPVATPTTGTKGLRDPYVFRKQDGTFIVMATDLSPSVSFATPNQYIHVWDSTDLRSFTNERLLRLHTMPNTFTWAPEAYWDASRQQYGLMFAARAADGSHTVIWVDYTSDFVNLSTAQVLYDGGAGVDTIDPDMTVVNGTGYLYVKNESTGRNQGLVSSTLAPGSFTSYTAGVVPGTGYAIEAPNVTATNVAGTYYLYGDSYSPVNGRQYVWTTSNIASGSWTLLSDRQYTQPLGDKHVGITRLTAAEMSGIESKWGAPTWKRLKSYNFPGYFVQHANFQGALKSYPTDALMDSEWKMVPGLADSAGVSFESVTFPGYYLRHSNFVLNLIANDGSTLFKQDSTFYRVAGLADSTWSSFRSYNYPTRYIRHSNFQLRVDAISDTPSQQDATFQVTY